MSTLMKEALRKIAAMPISESRDKRSDRKNYMEAVSAVRYALLNSNEYSSTGEKK